MEKFNASYLRAARLLKQESELRKRCEKLRDEAKCLLHNKGMFCYGINEDDAKNRHYFLEISLQDYLSRWPKEEPKAHTWVNSETGLTHCYMEYPNKYVGKDEKAGITAWVNARTPSVHLPTPKKPDPAPEVNGERKEEPCQTNSDSALSAKQN